MSDQHYETATLLPCPFCGDARPILDYAAREFESGWYAYCTVAACNAVGPLAEDGDEAAAARLWNTRSAPPQGADPERARCLACIEATAAEMMDLFPPRENPALLGATAAALEGVREDAE
jgi:hypothetical protein